MENNWNQMTIDEKLEALRKDVAVAFDNINRIAARVDDVANQTQTKLNRIEKMIDGIVPNLETVGKAVADLERKWKEV